MSHSSQFLLLDQPKMRPFSSGQKKIQAAQWNLKVIFYPSTSPKFDFGEVEKAMFQVLARHWEFIFLLLTSRKCDLGEVEKAMFKLFICHSELIFGFFTIPKCDFVEVGKALFQGPAWHFWVSGPSQNGI